MYEDDEICAHKKLNAQYIGEKTSWIIDTIRSLWNPTQPRDRAVRKNEGNNALLCCCQTIEIDLDFVQ